MDCRVVVEAAVPVYDVATADEAIRIAISKTGEMLNPDLNYVEINVGTRTSPSGEDLEPAFIVADEALVALELEMIVFNVEREEHASRIARKEIGQRMRNIPLDVIDVSVIEDGTNGDDEDRPNEPASTDDPTPDGGDEHSTDRHDEVTEAETETDETRYGTNGGADDAGDGADSDGDTVGSGVDDGDDILPEFEDLIDE